MNAQELFVKKEVCKETYSQIIYDSAQVYYCSKCKFVKKTKEEAEKCCNFYYDCRICGQKSEREHYLLCNKCDKIEKAKKEKELFDKAEKINIEDYKGMFYFDGDEFANPDIDCFLDDYFENVCEFNCPVCGGETESKDCLVNQGDENSYLSCKECAWNSPSFEIIDEIYYLFTPKYVWAPEFTPLELDYSNIMENACDQHHESVYDHIDGKKELKEAIDKFNHLNKDNGSYAEGQKRVIILNEEFIKKLYN